MSTEGQRVHIDHFHAGHRLALHRHANAYVALVVEGTYTEVSLDGRFACSPGSLVIHPPFHEHANEFDASPCKVLNLQISSTEGDLSGYRIVRSTDPEALIDLARDDAQAAGRAAIEELSLVAPVAPPQWVSRFVRLVLDNRPVCSAARSCGVTAEHAARVAKTWFGASPCQLRRESRIRRAIAALREGTSPAEAAIDAGFSDQPHLTRVLKAATGLTPARLRAR